MASSLPAPHLASTIDSATYEWKKWYDKPSLWRRRALAGDAVWLARPKDLHELFICGSLILESPIKLEPLQAAATIAWRHLRFNIPEIGIHATCGEDGVTYLQYQIPSDRDIDAWIGCAMAFEQGTSECDFSELRDLINFKKDEGDSLNAYLLVRVVTDTQVAESSSTLQVILNVDHQITDGIGIRVIFGRYLALLASFIADPNCLPPPKWQESHCNLLTPWLSMMNLRQVIKGPEYLEDAAACRDALLDTMTRNPGLPRLQQVAASTQETHFSTLAVTQTTKLLQVIKTIASDATITHLGHAAMIIATLRCAPQTADPGLSENFISPCWLNGRRYLEAIPNHPEPLTSFIPICQSFAPINFGAIKDMIVSPSATQKEIKDMLVKTFRNATSEYRKLKEKKSVLPGAVLLLEWLGQKACLEWLQEKSTTPLANQEMQPAQPLETSTPTAARRLSVTATQDPFFLSDGITEQYISRSFPDLPNTAVLRVEDVQFAANAGKEVIVRMSSWRGRTTVSGEWNGRYYEREMVIRFLQDVVDIMLCLIID